MFVSVVRAEVRQAVYQSSIGSWRRFSPFLQDFLGTARGLLNELDDLGALDFDDQVNWALAYQHDDYSVASASSKPPQDRRDR